MFSQKILHVLHRIHIRNELKNTKKKINEPGSIFNAPANIVPRINRRISDIFSLTNDSYNFGRIGDMRAR